MSPRKYAFYGGIVMLAMGLLALIPALSWSGMSELPALRVEASYGFFLGLFPMNILNKLALIAFGVIGILSAKTEGVSLPKSLQWSRVVFFVMGPLAILGIIRDTSTLYGFMPLFGAEIWAHAVFALIGGYFGFAYYTRARRLHHPAHHGV